MAFQKIKLQDEKMLKKQKKEEEKDTDKQLNPFEEFHLLATSVYQGRVKGEAKVMRVALKDGLRGILNLGKLPTKMINSNS